MSAKPNSKIIPPEPSIEAITGFWATLMTSTDPNDMGIQFFLNQFVNTSSPADPLINLYMLSGMLEFIQFFTHQCTTAGKGDFRGACDWSYFGAGQSPYSITNLAKSLDVPNYEDGIKANFNGGTDPVGNILVGWANTTVPSGIIKYWDNTLPDPNPGSSDTPNGMTGTFQSPGIAADPKHLAMLVGKLAFYSIAAKTIFPDPVIGPQLLACAQAINTSLQGNPNPNFPDPVYLQGSNGSKLIISYQTNLTS